MKNSTNERRPIVESIGQKVTVVNRLWYPNYRKLSPRLAKQGSLRARVTVAKIGRKKFTTSDGKVWDLFSGLLYSERNLTSIDRTWNIE